MSKSSGPLSAPWQFYTDHARQADRRQLDDLAFGMEELLWETLSVIESGILFTEGCRQRLNRLPRNRAKKYRRLRFCIRDRRPSELTTGKPHRSCFRHPLDREKLASAGTSCRTCGNEMTLAQKAAYGTICEDCWVGEANGLEVTDSISQVKRILSPDEWKVERLLAAGLTYAQIALKSDLTSDALKMRIGRSRARIREGAV